MTKKKKVIEKATDFDTYLAEVLKNPNNKRLFDEYGRQLEIAYQILQLRKEQKMSQVTLAKKIGSTQSNVARIESGQQNFSVNLLAKVAEALGAKLKISISA